MDFLHDKWQPIAAGLTAIASAYFLAKDESNRKKYQKIIDKEKCNNHILITGNLCSATCEDLGEKKYISQDVICVEKEKICSGKFNSPECLCPIIEERKCQMRIFLKNNKYKQLLIGHNTKIHWDIINTYHDKKKYNDHARPMIS